MVMEALRQPVPPGWDVRIAPGGRVYYAHHATRSTQWTRPVVVEGFQQEVAAQNLLDQERTAYQLRSMLRRSSSDEEFGFPGSLENLRMEGTASPLLQHSCSTPDMVISTPECVTGSRSSSIGLLVTSSTDPGLATRPVGATTRFSKEYSNHRRIRSEGFIAGVQRSPLSSSTDFDNDLPRRSTTLATSCSTATTPSIRNDPASTPQTVSPHDNNDFLHLRCSSDPARGATGSNIVCSILDHVVCSISESSLTERAMTPPQLLLRQESPGTGSGPKSYVTNPYCQSSDVTNRRAAPPRPPPPVGRYPSQSIEIDPLQSQRQHPFNR